MKPEDASVAYLAQKMNRAIRGEKTLEDEIMERIGEFIATTTEENLLVIEHWIAQTRKRREGHDTAWFR